MRHPEKRALDKTEVLEQLAGAFLALQEGERGGSQTSAPPRPDRAAHCPGHCALCRAAGTVGDFDWALSLRRDVRSGTFSAHVYISALNRARFYPKDALTVHCVCSVCASISAQEVRQTLVRLCRGPLSVSLSGVDTVIEFLLPCSCS